MEAHIYENCVTTCKTCKCQNNNIHHSIKQGYCLLVGFGKSSTEQDIETLAKENR